MRSLKVFLAIFLILVIAAPYVMAKTRENPVHEKRKAWREKRSEYYKGMREETEEEKKAAEEKARQAAKAKQDEKDKEKDKKAEKNRKGYKERLAELMKEFDKNGDGAISEEEMKAAREAKKDRELQTLLDIEKSKKDKMKKVTQKEVVKEE